MIRYLIASFFVQTVLYSAACLGDTSFALKGELTQGSLITGKVPANAQVKLDGKFIDVTKQGEFVFGFGRDASLEHEITWQLAGKEMHTEALVLKKREYRVQKIEGVPQKMVTPSADKTERIKAETRLVKRARKKATKHRFFLQKFEPPMVGKITGVYGSQRVFNGTPKRPHFGLDFAGPIGKLVSAPADGVVSLVHDDMYYSGGTLIVDHGYGVSSTFIHLSEILVQEGQVIRQGEAIARVGSGGRSTGPHLDWRINWYQVRIDPQLVLNLGEL